jgi:hypothetical protein
MGLFERPSRKKKMGIDKVDPNTFSRRVGPEERLVPWLPNRYFRSTKKSLKGERFHNLPERKEPEKQQAVARLLKGFVNVSDVVRIKGQWYSYEPKLSSAPQESPAAAEASQWILRCLFRDTDHRVLNYSEVPEFSFFPHNARVEDGKHMFFDFANVEFWAHPLFQGNIESMKDASPEILRIVHDKAVAMERHFAEAEGIRQIRAIFKSIEKETGKKLNDIFPDAWDKKERNLAEFIQEFQLRLRELRDSTA